MKNTMQLEILRIPKEIPTIARTLAVVFSCGGMIFYRQSLDESGIRVIDKTEAELDLMSF